MNDRKILLEVGDGPDGFTLYTSEEEAVVDWAAGVPALYMTVSVMGGYAKFGPFLPGVLKQLLERLPVPIEVRQDVLPFLETVDDPSDRENEQAD